MIVADDHGVSDALESLARVDGFRSLKCGSETGRPALAALRDADGLIFDHHTPGLSGLQVLSMLRDRGSDIPAIFVTGTTTDGMQGKARDLGAFAVLEAMFLDEELGGTIRRATKRLR